MSSVMIRKSSRVKNAAQKRLRLEGGNQITKAGKWQNVTFNGESMELTKLGRMVRGRKCQNFRFFVTNLQTEQKAAYRLPLLYS